MSLPTLDHDGDKKKKPSGLPSMDMPPIGMPDVDEVTPTDFDTDNFEEVPTQQALYEEGDEELNGEIYDEIEEDDDSELPNMQDEEREIYASEEDYNPDYEEDLAVEDESKFIDKKKKRLIPFGGKKSRKPKSFVKSSDFDERKNKLAKTKITQFMVLSIIAILFLVGLKNTFIPSHVYTENQIRQFAAESVGQTGFPQERGKTYVENFMNSYLTFDRSQPELLDMLAHYYGKDRISGSSVSSLNMNWGYEAKQNVIVPAKVIEVDLLTDYSAQYVVTAYVSNSDGQLTSGRSVVGRWLTFAINVYHDKGLDALAITADSPIIIPPQQIQDQTKIPNGKNLGTGQVNKEVFPAMSPTIDGFVEAFAKSSIKSHDPVLQYISDRNDINLYDGFGGSLKLDGSPSNAIKKVIYNTLTEGFYEVDVTVNWVDVAASQGNNKVSYTSRYKMGVVTQGEGKFAVTSFVPYMYYK